MDLCAAETFITKINISNKNAYAKINWRNSLDNLFQIQILIENQSWSGLFSYDNAKIFQERLHKSNEEYSKEVKDALKQNDEMYIFQLNSSGDSRIGNFCWKKTFSESTAVVLHGSVNIECDGNEISNDKIIDYLLDQNKNLQSNIDEYKKRNDTLISELEKNRDEFKKLVDLKNSLESNLYGKFIQLLNTKKRRIKLLECDIENLNEQK